MKILIIQQKMIGDVLTSSILFEAIKSKYPDAELHYVINTHTYQVVENNPFIDKFHFFTKEHENSLKATLAFGKFLQMENYDAVIDVYSKTSSNIVSFRTKAKKRISKYKWYTSFLYTHTVKEGKEPKTSAGLAIENRLSLLEPLNIKSEVIKPKIYLTASELQKGETILLDNGLDLTKPLYMIAVLGSGINKTYPLKYMAHVLDTIITEQPNAQLIFNYIPTQYSHAKEVYEYCKPVTKNQIFLDLFGKSLREFLTLTIHCTALIGNEGGATNMAKALDIPTFTIFSPWIDKKAWNMFEDGIRHKSVHLQDYESKRYNKIAHYKDLKNDFKNLYENFRPEYFKEDLTEFLDQLT
ncbi:glycosyltransferase family 9 protein [Winogradskyella alexanderae]|uniref:Glycosyltransferase family 9 protein n=1 Tax=Winogradskyella alexanderae TaxID=2877123 RepID=A0ABS7XRP7_9FLAO|nr:glycosyltransferase family 9 protein [Winogradskyella alexanderae]MCA0132098.1 glycosyltransferase family 9 protein [Winogradskyella alexanderae]